MNLMIFYSICIFLSNLKLTFIFLSLSLSLLLLLFIYFNKQSSLLNVNLFFRKQREIKYFHSTEILIIIINEIISFRVCKCIIKKKQTKETKLVTYLFFLNLINSSKSIFM